MDFKKSGKPIEIDAYAQTPEALLAAYQEINEALQEKGFVVKDDTLQAIGAAALQSKEGEPEQADAGSSQIESNEAKQPTWKYNDSPVDAGLIAQAGEQVNRECPSLGKEQLARARQGYVHGLNVINERRYKYNAPQIPVMPAQDFARAYAVWVAKNPPIADYAARERPVLFARVPTDQLYLADFDDAFGLLNDVVAWAASEKTTNVLRGYWYSSLDRQGLGPAGAHTGPGSVVFGLMPSQASVLMRGDAARQKWYAKKQAENGLAKGMNPHIPSVADVYFYACAAVGDPKLQGSAYQGPFLHADLPSTGDRNNKQGTEFVLVSHVGKQEAPLRLGFAPDQPLPGVLVARGWQ